RKAQVLRQARTAVLGGWLDFTLHYGGIAPELDLGDAFRALPTSEVPVLLLSGTLDGRTVVESQREAVAGLRNLTHIVVENGGHNLPFPATIRAVVDRFMAGESVGQTTLTIPLPDFGP